MDDKKLDELLGDLAKEEDKDFSPEFYRTEMDRILARKKEIEEEDKALDQKLERMFKELAKEEDKDFSPEFYETEMDRIMARRKEIEEEEKGGPKL